MRQKLVTLVLLLLPGVLTAQTVADWFKHPALSAASLITESFDVQQSKFSTRPLAMLRAGFGSEENVFRATFIFDLPSTRFLTCEGVWQPLPQVGVRFGLQKMLFQYETTFAPYTFGMVGYSQGVSALSGYSSDMTGINSRSRDVGIVLQGSFFPAEGGFSRLSYALGVFNGNGYSFIDNNRAKDVHIRLLYQPIAQLKISVGAMNGYYTPNHADGPGHDHSHTSESLACRRRLATGAWFENGKWFARTENIYGITDGTRSDGFMAMAGVGFLPRLNLAARVDRFQQDMSNPLTTSTKADLCFTHNLTSDGTIYYSIQYGHTFYSDPAQPGTDSLLFCVNVALMHKL